MNPTIGIIGGSGLYSMPGFEAQEERALDTPWGAPSDAFVVGKLAGMAHPGGAQGNVDQARAVPDQVISMTRVM